MIGVTIAGIAGAAAIAVAIMKLWGGRSGQRPVDSPDSSLGQPRNTAGAARLAAVISSDFYENRLDPSSRGDAPLKGASWDTMPEVRAAGQLRAQKVPDAAVRMFLAFIAAVDRARDATALWRAGVSLFGSHPEVFDPRQAADLPYSTLRRLLTGSGVSQRRDLDARAWRRIARSLAVSERSRVYDVIHRGIGDAEELLKEVRAGRGYPMLRAPRIGPMWVRMLAEPGGATIARLDRIPVAVDVHVRRTTENLGVTNTGDLDVEAARPLIQLAWQKAVAGVSIGGPARIAGSCAALDPALWSFGKYGCSYCERAGTRLPVSSACGHCRLRT